MKFIFVLLLFSSSLLYCQDTNFISKHIFPTPVRNVFKAEHFVYVKTGDGLYKREREKWVLQEARFGKPYVFFDKSFYEAYYIPSQYEFNVQQMIYLIPQKAITAPTAAQVDDRLFVSVGGSLFEYEINKYYMHYYKNVSVRDIYLEKNFKVISTYGGVYINDSFRVPEPAYSSGSLCKVNGKYYLCSDKLYVYSDSFTFRHIEAATTDASGLVRKLVKFNDNIYSQNTKSINVLNSAFKPRAIHQGYEYTDMEVCGSVLLFCTSTGEVFEYNGQTATLLFDIDTRIRNIFKFRNLVYFSTDAGLYSMKDLQPKTLTLVSDLPFVVKTVIDINNNAWIATENGLYLLPEKEKKPIPFINGVEFNRGALTCYNDTIYVGSIAGLYVIDCDLAIRDFLPQYLNKTKVTDDGQRKTKLIIIKAVFVLLMGAGYLYYRRRRKISLAIPQKELELTLDKIAEDIKSNHIMSVEALAECYNTNPVQLNRLFKSFNTTPGKFMKKVKLNFAKELLQSGKTIEEVVTTVGYSATYLKKAFRYLQNSI